MKIIRLLLVASAAFFIASAQAQNGTVANHAVPIGKGPGVTGSGAAVPGTAGLPLVSNGASSDPSFGAITAGALPALTGDVTSTAGSAATTISNSAVTTAKIASGAVGTGQIANNAVTNAQAAQMPADTVKCNATGSTANAQDCTTIPSNVLPVIPLTLGGLGASQSAATAHQIPVFPGSGGAAVPTSATSWFDAAYCNTVGYLIVRTTGAWTCSKSVTANPVWWGADPTGAADSTSAFTTMVSALGSKGNIFIPCGTYKISGTINFSIPGSNGSITVAGAGMNCTVLNVVSGVTPLVFSYGDMTSTAHVRDLTILPAGAYAGVSAITIQQENFCNGFPAWNPISDVSNVSVLGNGANYFGYGIYTNNVSNINFVGYNYIGSSSYQGAGLDITGTDGFAPCGPGNQPAVAFNVIASNFGSFNTGILYGTQVQGVFVTNSNFTNSNATATGIGINTSGNGLDELTVTASQFGALATAISQASATNSTGIVNNLFIIPASANAIVLNSTECTVVGNVFAGTGASGTNTAINHAVGASCAISGNSINDLVNGILLGASSSLDSVGVNTYRNVTTHVSNSGTSNCVQGGGTACP